VIPGRTERGGRSRDSKSKTERYGHSGIQGLEGRLKMIAPTLGPVAVALCGIAEGIQAH
jgi:hypothetical protein